MAELLIYGYNTINEKPLINADLRKVRIEIGLTLLTCSGNSTVLDS